MKRFIFLRKFLIENCKLGVLINNHLRCFAHGACFRIDTGDIEDHPGHGNLPSITEIYFLISILSGHIRRI